MFDIFKADCSFVAPCDFGQFSTKQFLHVFFDNFPFIKLFFKISWHCEISIIFRKPVTEIVVSTFLLYEIQFEAPILWEHGFVI